MFEDGMQLDRTRYVMMFPTLLKLGEALVRNHRVPKGVACYHELPLGWEVRDCAHKSSDDGIRGASLGLGGGFVPVSQFQIVTLFSFQIIRPDS